MALPVDITPNDPRHVEIHVEANTEINRISGLIGPLESSTSTPAAGAIPRWDSSKRLKAATPSAADDLTTKAYTDNAITQGITAALARPAKNLPAGITDRPGTFNGTTHVYWPDSLRPESSKLILEAARQGAALNTLIGAAGSDKVTNTQVIYMGDSEVVGTGAVVGREDAAAQAMSLLSSAGWITPDGLIMAYDNNKDNGITNGDARRTLTGTWSVGGIKGNAAKMDYQYHLSTNVAGSTIKFDFDRAGTAIEIYHFRNSAAFTYSVDGGAAKTFTPSGVSQAEVLTISGLSNAAHEVTVTHVSGTIYILGGRSFAPNSMEISKVGFWGARAVAGLPRTWWNMPAVFARLQPDAIVLQYGTNEALHGGYTVDQYKGLMAGVIHFLRKAVPDAPIMLISSFQPNVTDAVWTQWRNAQYDVADQNGILLGDCVSKVGSRSVATALGLYSDATHPNKAGYAKQAELLRDLLLTH